MSEYDWTPYTGPCPECGGTEFLETTTQDQIVHCDENGEPEYFEPQGTIETIRVWCRECDTLIFGDEP